MVTAGAQQIITPSIPENKSLSSIWHVRMVRVGMQLSISAKCG
jgi:hypothetical protein